VSFEFPFDDLVAIDKRREIGLVGDVEEDLERADQEPHHVELPERQDVRDVRERDGRIEGRAAEVADDQDRAPRQPVDPDAGGEREQDEREEENRAEHGHLEDARVEHEDGDERERDVVDRRAELADRLRRPELQEVAVAPETAPRPEAMHRGSA
jgi:hypothetical protein